MTPKVAAGMVMCYAVWSASFAGAQTFDQLQIRAEGNVVRPDGGEQTQVFYSSGALEIGKPTNGAMGYSARFCGVAAGPRLQPNTLIGWSFEFTPTRVQGNAVTFHMRWSRVDGGKLAAPVDMDLTLRPGESIPIDTHALTAASTAPPTCRFTATTHRLTVDYWPPPEDETRLVATDLWLVEKAADGTEHTQQLTLRGVPNQSLPFYFAPLLEGGVALDIYGELQAAPGQDQIALNLVVRSRIVEGGRSSTNWRDGNRFTSREITPTIKVKPGEVVSVELPRLSENQTGAFASRTLSLRLRSQQLR